MIALWPARYITHLEDEIADLRAQVRHERDRAEAAINALLMARGTQPVVAQPEVDSREQKMRELLFNSPEMAAMGSLEGVPGLPVWAKEER